MPLPALVRLNTAVAASQNGHANRAIETGAAVGYCPGFVRAIIEQA